MNVAKKPCHSTAIQSKLHRLPTPVYANYGKHTTKD